MVYMLVTPFPQAVANLLEKDIVEGQTPVPVGELGFISGTPDYVRERKVCSYELLVLYS